LGTFLGLRLQCLESGEAFLLYPVSDSWVTASRLVLLQFNRLAGVSMHGVLSQIATRVVENKRKATQEEEGVEPWRSYVEVRLGEGS